MNRFLAGSPGGTVWQRLANGSLGFSRSIAPRTTGRGLPRPVPVGSGVPARAGASPHGRRPSIRTAILCLVAIGVATSFLPLYLTSAALRDEVAHLDHERQSLRATIGAASTPLPEALALKQTLTHLEASIGQLDQLRPTLESASIRWPAVVAAIGGRDPARIVLQSVTQKGREITLKGRASDAPAVARYASDLEASGLFERVAVQSLRALASPFVTPTGASGPSPTETPTPTATAGPGDEYEPDDWEPKSIYAGQPQVHSFFPASDVDNVRFLAKAGRHYRVFTSDLAPGVDTFLTVRVADQTYTNDDVAPRTLRSEVTFQVPPDTDVLVIVQISNRGDYGPDMTYKVAYEEITPAPTPVTPTQAPTPTATRTATPAPTLTPTPDLRDAYEPDDTVPKPIAVGQPQAHSFYPAGDIDLAAFVAGAGRSYRVSTSGLSPGVDTVLEVQVGAAVYTGDDRQPGDPSSEVVFQVFGSQPVTVLITVRNRGQYGPDKMYQLTVEEMSAASAQAAPANPAGPSGPDGEARGARPAAMGPGYLVASGQAADGARSCSSRSHAGALAPASSAYLQTAGSVEFVIVLVVRQ